MREYRSEFSPEHGVWILKRVPRAVRQEDETVRLLPPPPQRLQLVRTKSAARS